MQSTVTTIAIGLPLQEWARTCAIFRAYVHAYTARCWDCYCIYGISQVDTCTDPIRDSQGARVKWYAARVLPALPLRVDIMSILRRW